MVMKPDKLKRKKIIRIPRFMFWRSTTVLLRLFCACALCVNYVSEVFLLASSSEVITYCVLCTVNQKHTTKNFTGRHNNFPFSTLPKLTPLFHCIQDSSSFPPGMLLLIALSPQGNEYSVDEF